MPSNPHRSPTLPPTLPPLPAHPGYGDQDGNGWMSIVATGVVGLALLCALPDVLSSLTTWASDSLRKIEFTRSWVSPSEGVEWVDDDDDDDDEDILLTPQQRHQGKKEKGKRRRRRRGGGEGGQGASAGAGGGGRGLFGLRYLPLYMVELVVLMATFWVNAPFTLYNTFFLPFDDDPSNFIEHDHWKQLTR